MSSEILFGNPASVAPVFWRTVAAISEDKDGRSDAEREAARRLAETRREGFAEGVAAGRHETEQRVLPAVENLARTLADLARTRERIREEAIQDLVRLAVTIAARVIHREIVIDPDALAGLVKAAFAKVQAREISRVRMHPALEALVRKCLEQSGSPENLVLMVDTSLLPGEVFFETAQGMLDASVDTQLREIERGLIDKLSR
ncbi:MAG: FliH/SctL family protein [Bryobacteraceae bacterium]|jgi:flagellar assembly protein FliH